MNLFNEIQGLSGENLTSTLLRVLLLRSQEFRDHFLGVLSKKSPVGPLSSNTRFACSSEEASEDEQAGCGRLDILLEVDDCLIGIENKFSANFQAQQPAKYLKRLKELREQYKIASKRHWRAVLYVLAPSSRQREVGSHLQSNECRAKERDTDVKLAQVDWDNVFKLRDDELSKLDPESRVIYQLFADFVDRLIAFIPDFVSMAADLRQRFEPKGTPYQQRVVRALWNVFNESGLEPGKRWSAGPHWCGYYFGATSGGPLPDFKSVHGWFGFVPHARIKLEGNGAELVISSALDKTPPLKGSGVRLLDGVWLWPGTRSVWLVNFDESWTERQHWDNALAELFSHLQPSPDVPAELEPAVPPFESSP